MTDDEITLNEVLNADVFKAFADEALKTSSAAYVTLPASAYPFSATANATCEPFYRSIAHIANCWSLFERICDAIIWDMAQISPQKGAYLTSQFHSVYTRFKVIAALHIQLNGSKDTAKKINEAGRLCQKISKRRNRAVHDPIAYNPVIDEMMSDRLDEDRTLLRSTIPVKLSYYTETIQMIDVSTAGLIAIGKLIRMEQMLYVTALPSLNISIRLLPFPPLS